MVFVQRHSCNAPGSNLATVILKALLLQQAISSYGKAPKGPLLVPQIKVTYAQPPQSLRMTLTTCCRQATGMLSTLLGQRIARGHDEEFGLTCRTGTHCTFCISAIVMIGC
ncbi:hypothetical protein SAMN05216271_2111 [Halopseudomonas sabulinigri]|uniref:Uncharacterized protein n=1 Tax=Halopseudomonas sabulinigri TaxID=472181 RepID=A0A1H1SWL0_9GAMM|nr:hypothetical protein SAMN05216271_2111 [Halopseudomonas sabulinigri]